MWAPSLIICGTAGSALHWTAAAKGNESANEPADEPLDAPGIQIWDEASQP